MATTEVSLEQGRAVVEYDPDILVPARMVEAIQRSVILPGLRRAIARTARSRSVRSRRRRD